MAARSQPSTTEHTIDTTGVVDVATGRAVGTLDTVLLKVASRCNIDCSYCYVFHSADQGWRDQPARMSNETIASYRELLMPSTLGGSTTSIAITFPAKLSVGNASILILAEYPTRSKSLIDTLMNARNCN